MRIEIDISVANDPSVHTLLDRILHRIDDGWHVWDTTRQPNPEEIEATTWIRDRGYQGDWVRQMLVASIRRAAWTLEPHERRIRVTTHPSGPEEVSPDDALRLADEYLVILVENRISDGSFVKRVVAELDKSLHALWRRPGAPVRFDSLGGEGQMEEEVERQTRGKSYRPRLVAIIDSNRKGPDDTDSRSARRLRATCVRLGVPCWVLAKRESENYLPRILLSQQRNAGTSYTQLVEAWDRLTDDQKNFFDMKSGLPDELSETEQDLFDELSVTDRKILSSGFGSNVSQCWTLWSGQARNELRRRGQGDLERGIEQIRRAV